MSNFGSNMSGWKFILVILLSFLVTSIAAHFVHPFVSNVWAQRGIDLLILVIVGCIIIKLLGRSVK